MKFLCMGDLRQDGNIKVFHPVEGNIYKVYDTYNGSLESVVYGRLDSYENVLRLYGGVVAVDTPMDMVGGEWVWSQGRLVDTVSRHMPSKVRFVVSDAIELRIIGKKFSAILLHLRDCLYFNGVRLAKPCGERYYLWCKQVSEEVCVIRVYTAAGEYLELHGDNKAGGYWFRDVFHPVGEEICYSKILINNWSPEEDLLCTGQGDVRFYSLGWGKGFVAMEGGGIPVTLSPTGVRVGEMMYKSPKYFCLTALYLIPDGKVGLGFHFAVEDVRDVFKYFAWKVVVDGQGGYSLDTGNVVQQGKLTSAAQMAKLMLLCRK